MSDKVVNVYVGECFQEGGQAGGEGKAYGLSLTGNKLKLVENGQQSEVDLPAGGGGELSNAVIDKVSAFINGIFEIKLDPLQVYYGGQNKTYPLIVTGNGDNVPLMLNFYGDVASDSDYLVLEGFFNTKGSPLKTLSYYSLFDPDTHDFFYKGKKVEFNNGGNLDVTSIPKGLPFVQLEAKRRV